MMIKPKRKVNTKIISRYCNDERKNKASQDIAEYSHDMKNPLQTIIGYIELFSYNLLKSTEGNVLPIEHQLETGKKIKEKINNLLSYATREEAYEDEIESQAKDIFRDVTEYKADLFDAVNASYKQAEPNTHYALDTIKEEMKDLESLTAHMFYSQELGSFPTKMATLQKRIDRYPVESDLKNLNEKLEMNLLSLKRVIGNLMNNINHYGKKGTKTTVTGHNHSKNSNGINCYILEFKNKIGNQKSKGYGIGLRSTQRLLEEVNGSLETKIEEGYFKATITVPVTQLI